MPDYTDKFRTLASEYAHKEIEFPELKDITLAQWMLESGRGSSDLASLHNNFGGLKWRSEMAGFAVPVHYVAHDGPDTYCAFASERDFITGYWRFLERAPYRGWREAAGSDENFIHFIGRIYAPAATSYAERVLNLRAEARTLLADAGAPPIRREEDDSHGTSAPYVKPPVKQFLRSPNRQARNGVRIARVVLHYTTNTLQSALNTFMNPSSRVSAHYVVDKNGDIYQMVEDNQVAWHCRGANSDSIGIEHAAFPGDALAAAQEASTVALVKWLPTAYELKAGNVTGHNFTPGRRTATDCPHSLFGRHRPGDDAANRRTIEEWVSRHFSEFA